MIFVLPLETLGDGKRCLKMESKLLYRADEKCLLKYDAEKKQNYAECKVDGKKEELRCNLGFELSEKELPYFPMLSSMNIYYDNTKRINTISCIFKGQKAMVEDKEIKAVIDKNKKHKYIGLNSWPEPKPSSIFEGWSFPVVDEMDCYAGRSPSSSITKIDTLITQMNTNELDEGGCELFYRANASGDEEKINKDIFYKCKTTIINSKKLLKREIYEFYGVEID